MIDLTTLPAWILWSTEKFPVSPALTAMMALVVCGEPCQRPHECSWNQAGNMILMVSNPAEASFETFDGPQAALLAAENIFV
jgi:hypothetical protein